MAKLTPNRGQHYGFAANLLFYQSNQAMSCLIALVCSATALGAHSSDAQKAKLVVVPFGVEEGVSQSAAFKFQALIVAELKSRSEMVELVAPPPFKRDTAAEGASSAQRVRAAQGVEEMEEGRKAFEALRFDAAVTNLKKGIAGMLSDPATADYEAVADAHVKLAAAAFRMGEEQQAKATLQELARLFPGYPLPAGFPPVFQREYDKAKKRLESHPRATVSIEGPPGSTAFLDGRDLGMVPVLEENVWSGDHYIKLEDTAGHRFGQTIKLKSGVMKVKGSFQPPQTVPDPAISSIVDDATQSRLAAYLQHAQADWALIGFVSRSNQDAMLSAGCALFSLSAGAFMVLPSVSFDMEMLTANTEAFKLGQEVTKGLASLTAGAPLPLSLGRAPRATQPVLVPRPAQPRQVEVVLPEEPAPSSSAATSDVKPRSSVWIWVGVGIGVAALAGAGTFAIMGVTNTGPFKPVTGTVVATW